jgi:hypothetical protein
MHPNLEEETKTLLSGNDSEHSCSDLNAGEDELKGTLVTAKPSPRARATFTYFFLFFVLAMNTGLLIASWRVQEEIRCLYSNMGRDIKNLPRPDQFAGLPKGLKNRSAGKGMSFMKL